MPSRAADSSTRSRHRPLCRRARARRLRLRARRDRGRRHAAPGRPRRLGAVRQPRPDVRADPARLRLHADRRRRAAALHRTADPDALAVRPEERRRGRGALPRRHRGTTPTSCWPASTRGSRSRRLDERRAGGRARLGQPDRDLRAARRDDRRAGPDRSPCSAASGAAADPRRGAAVAPHGRARRRSTYPRAR